MTAGVRIEDLRVAVRGSTLLDGVRLGAESGEWVSVIGPNGAGKSTLLRAVAGVIRSTGMIEVDGREVRSLGPRDRGRLVAWVPQTPTIPTGITVFDYVLLGRTPHLGLLSRERDLDLDVVRGVLNDLDLADLGKRTVDTLSGGELQRAVIARALAQQAPLLLLDEPTAALDLGHQQEVLRLLARLRTERGCTIISTMHDLTLAGAFADRLVLLAGGRVVAEGDAVEVLTADNVERHYRARVTVTDLDGQVHVAPLL